MRAWIVPSALFVSGRIMQPLRLYRDLEEARARRVSAVAELVELPAKITALDAHIAALSAQLQTFKEIK